MDTQSSYFLQAKPILTLKRNDRLGIFAKSHSFHVPDRLKFSLVVKKKKKKKEIHLTVDA